MSAEGPGRRLRNPDRVRSPRGRWRDPQAAWEPSLDGTVAAILALIALLSRLPFRTRYLHGWDSYLFALGIDHYDLWSAHPHFPGYPLYIGMGKLLTFVTGDPNSALLVLGLLAATAAAPLLYGLVREFGSRRAAGVATLLFCLAPVFYFQSLVALSYSLEVPTSLAVAWLSWRAWDQSRPRELALLGVVFSFGLGIRLSLLFTLSPLVIATLFVRFRSKEPWLRRAVPMGAMGAVVCAAWFFPMVGGAGGFARWRSGASLHANEWVFQRTVFNEGLGVVPEKASQLFQYLKPEIWLVIVLLLLAVGLLIIGLAPVRWRRFIGGPAGTGPFYALWLLPGICMILFVYSFLFPRDNSGYVLVFLPGLYALYALVADAALRVAETRLKTARLRRGAVWVSVPLLLLPSVGLGLAAEKTIREDVQGPDHWASQWADLGQYFPPNETAFLVRSLGPFAQWYYPDHLVWHDWPVTDSGGRRWLMVFEYQHRRSDVPFYEAYARAAELPPHPIPANIKTIVGIDSDLPHRPAGMGDLNEDVSFEWLTLPNGARAVVIHPDPEHPTIESYLHR